MPFQPLAHWLPDLSGLPDVQVKQVTCDSRLVKSGDAFFAIAGSDFDGHNFIPQALAAGAATIICQQPTNGVPVPQVVVKDSAAEFAKAVFRNRVPHHDIASVGITGTNGKTTTTWMLHSILTADGRKTGMMGTVETFDGQVRRPSAMTTASPEDLATHYHNLQRNQCSINVMEVSSHALAQRRCAALTFAAAAITNVTHDHLDYHGTITNYRSAKALIADRLQCNAPLIVNQDDQGCREIAAQLPDVECLGFSTDDPSAPFFAEVISRTHRSQRLRLRLNDETMDVRLRQIGQHNVENALAACALAVQMGVSAEAIATGLEQLKAVPGRLERVDEGQPFLVLVDYAHTADALERCLTTIRRFVPGRIICLFGAGGDRDREKRPLMGQASSLADRVILTSDNPRSEDPVEIIREVRSGMKPHTLCDEITDRLEAIEFGCQIAEPGDVLLIAGKGHETRQHVEGTSVEFDDRRIVRAVLRSNSLAACDLQPVFPDRRIRLKSSA